MKNITNIFSGAKTAVQSAKFRVAPVVCGVAGTTALTAVSCFAAEGDTNTLPTFTITQDMLTPVVTGITSNIGVILPVGLALFAIIIGIRLIPGMLSSFVRMR